MTGQSIYKCSALFDRIIQGYFSHLDMLWRAVSQVSVKWCVPVYIVDGKNPPVKNGSSYKWYSSGKRQINTIRDTVSAGMLPKGLFCKTDISLLR